MMTSILAAKILGVLYLSFFFGLLYNGKYYKKALPQLVQNSGYLILGGFMAIIFGLLILEYHNQWYRDWRVVITLFGWIALFKGVVLIIFPPLFTSFKDSILLEKNHKYFLIILLLMGLFFGYFGFVSSLV
jgi:hypothetical protein